MTNNEFIAKFPQGDFKLHRVPENTQLRAWDAADEYLLEELNTSGNTLDGKSVLIVNDNFGALSVALSKYDCTEWNDSQLSRIATEKNYQLNDLPSDKRIINQSIEFPDQVFDIVLLRLPKSADLLEHQLYQLRKNLRPDTQLIAADMSKHIHSSTLKHFEAIIGPTTTSLARKKARLIFCHRDERLSKGESKWPARYQLEADREYDLLNQANVFCNNRLDHGTRLLLQALPDSDDFNHIADLGCGNGILGLVAASLNPSAKISFFDESLMAIDSARSNFANNFPDASSDQQRASFHAADGLSGVVDETFDLILNNPPFHQQYVIGDSIAWQMFMQSRDALKIGGELRIVGNRHLGYHSKLKKIFGNCELVTSDKKFSVLSSIKK